MQDVGLSLPPINTKTIIVDWSYEEKLIRDLLNNTDLTATIYKPSDVSYYRHLIYKLIGYTPGGKPPVILTILLRARQLCISPVLFRKKIEELIDVGELDSTYKQLYSCPGKLYTVSNTIVENKMNSNRKIVFSHFTAEINQLYEMIVDNDDVDKYDDTQVAIYSGSLNLKQRQEILENDSIEVLIMQIQTGCEGLNLQQYSDIYMVSPDWNPALEDQAIARCHRQGQLKETNVYRFTMKGSKNMDGYIRNIQYYKRKEMEIVEPSFDHELITQFSSL